MTNDGPRIEPCSTPAWIVSQSDVWPLSITLWNLPLKNHAINWYKHHLVLTETLISHDKLYQMPNASDMSRNTPQVSLKLKKLLWMITSSWKTEKSPAWKPSWSLADFYLSKIWKVR